MPGGVTRQSNIIPGPRTPGVGNDLGPEVAGQTFTVPKYPGGLDDVGTGSALEFADDSTVLSSLWINFAAAIVHAIEAEVGPIATNPGSTATRVAGFQNLRDLLDNISSAASTGKKGALRGFKRVSVTQAGSLFNAIGSMTVVLNHPTSFGRALFWGYTLQDNRHSNAQMIAGPTSVRGYATRISSTTYTLRYRGNACIGPGVGGSPVSSAAGSFTMEGVLVFLPKGNADA